jgi:quercetin dioxygenase-like cupin family protein
VLPRSPPEGVMFCITNISPGGVTPMHRTLSVDYCVVLTGEVVLELDGGERRIVRAGEFVVQGGTNHRWINQTDEVCRVAVVGVGAQKVRLASGEELEETVFQQK